MHPYTEDRGLGTSLWRQRCAANKGGVAREVGGSQSHTRSSIWAPSSSATDASERRRRHARVSDLDRFHPCAPENEGREVQPDGDADDYHVLRNDPCSLDVAEYSIHPLGPITQHESW